MERTHTGGRAPIIIYAPPFDETVGGRLVLHLLCKRLRDAGENASIWPSTRPFPPYRGTVGVRRRISALTGSYMRHYDAGPFGNPIANRRDAAHATAVYPEIVDGNPIGAPAVARWLLHRPGFHTGSIDYGGDDLFFFYNPAFLGDPTGKIIGGPLTLTYIPEVYHQDRDTIREGTCHLVRKGADRISTSEFSSRDLVDGKSHADVADMFRSREKMYSYDLYTMYNYFAAICGCVPVVVPQPGLSKTEWQPDERLRYGLAYGDDDLDWAIATRPKLLQRLAALRAEEDRMIAHFVDKCMNSLARRNTR